MCKWCLGRGGRRADYWLSQLEPRISHHARGAERSREHLQVSIQLVPVLFQVPITFLATSRWSDLEDEPVMSDTVAYDMHTLRRYLSFKNQSAGRRYQNASNAKVYGVLY